MDCAEQQKQQEEGEVVEVPEVDADLLVELLDASLEEPDEAACPQLGFTTDDDVVIDCWDESHELNSIHPHHDCEDCGLDGGGVLSGFELDGCGCSRSPSPYVAFDDDDTAQWTDDTAEAAALGPFMGEWYMDGMVMEWEEEDEGNDFSFGPYYVGEGGTEQVYGSPLWKGSHEHEHEPLVCWEQV